MKIYQNKNLTNRAIFNGPVAETFTRGGKVFVTFQEMGKQVTREDITEKVLDRLLTDEKYQRKAGWQKI